MALGVAEGIAGGAQVLGGIAQYYQSEKARNATSDKLDEIEDAFNAIKPPDYDVTVMDPPDYITESVPEPAFDFSNLTPEQYKVVGQFSPTAAKYIAEKNPDVIAKSAEGQTGRKAQMDALQRFRDIATTGTDPVAEQLNASAARSAQVAAQSRQESILQDAARRGQLGSGATLAAQLQGGSDAMERAAMMSQQAATDAYRAKLEAMRQSADIGGDVVNQDVSEQGKNVDIINAFNQRSASGKQAYENALADLANKGQLYNLDQSQTAADRNVGAANDAAKYNLERKTGLQSEQYRNRLAEQARQNQIIGSKAQWKSSERDTQNALKSQNFQNNMQRQGRLAEVGGAQIQNIQGAAADRNKAIQGVTGAVSASASRFGGGASAPGGAAPAASSSGPAPQGPQSSNEGWYQDMDAWNKGYK